MQTNPEIRINTKIHKDDPKLKYTEVVDTEYFIMKVLTALDIVDN